MASKYLKLVNGSIKQLDATVTGGTPEEAGALVALDENGLIDSSVLNIPSSEDIQNAITDSHTHTNKSVLDSTTEAFTSALKSTYDGYSTSKQDVLGFTPENSANKGIANGYASLDENGLVPVSQLPVQVKECLVVENITARNAITDLFSGLRVYVINASDDPTVESGGADYVYDGTQWIKTSEAESLDLVLSWDNLLNKPTSSVSAIDQAVTDSHTHTNKSVLDLTTEAFTSSLKAIYDGYASGKQDTLGFTPENSANKGAANGYASLDSSGIVPIAQLPKTLKATYRAATAIPQYSVVALDPSNVGSEIYVRIASSSSVIDGYETIGIAVTAAADANDVVEVVSLGPVTNAAWNFAAGTKLFLGTNGSLTSTPPETGVFLQVAQVAKATNTVFVNVRTPIEL